MRVISVDANNDIYRAADGNLAIATGLTAVLQACAQAVKVMTLEMVLSYDQGMPNFQAVWSGKPNVAQFEAAARSRLLAVPNVLEVTEFTAVVSGGVLRYSASIKSIYGESVLNG